MLVGYGMVGIGSILSPQIVQCFQEESYQYMAVFYLLLFIVFSVLPHPKRGGQTQR